MTARRSTRPSRAVRPRRPLRRVVGRAALDRTRAVAAFAASLALMALRRRLKTRPASLNPATTALGKESIRAPLRRHAPPPSRPSRARVIAGLSAMTDDHHVANHASLHAARGLHSAGRRRRGVCCGEPASPLDQGARDARGPLAFADRARRRPRLGRDRVVLRGWATRPGPRSPRTRPSTRPPPPPVPGQRRDRSARSGRPTTRVSSCRPRRCAGLGGGRYRPRPALALAA